MVTLALPQAWPSAGVLTVSSAPQPSRWQTTFFEPPAVQVAALTTSASFQLWPSAFTASVLVYLQPEFVQEIVFTPAFVQVGSVVILPLSHL